MVACSLTYNVCQDIDEGGYETGEATRRIDNSRRGVFCLKWIQATTSFN